MSEKTSPAYLEGRDACNSTPPKRRGLGIYARPFGLNPYELFSLEYHQWDEGYEDRTAEMVAKGELK